MSEKAAGEEKKVASVEGLLSKAPSMCLERTFSLSSPAKP